jgi:hypothetical protein
MKMFVFVALLYNYQTGQVNLLRTVHKCQYAGATESKAWVLSHPFVDSIYLDSGIYEEDVTADVYIRECTGGYTYDLVGEINTEYNFYPGIFLPRYFNSCAYGEAK